MQVHTSLYSWPEPVALCCTQLHGRVGCVHHVAPTLTHPLQWNTPGQICGGSKRMNVITQHGAWASTGVRARASVGLTL